MLRLPKRRRNAARCAGFKSASVSRVVIVVPRWLVVGPKPPFGLGYLGQRALVQALDIVTSSEDRADRDPLAAYLEQALVTV